MNKLRVGDILVDPGISNYKYLVCQDRSGLRALYLHTHGFSDALYVEEESLWLNNALDNGFKVIGNILENSNGNPI